MIARLALAAAFTLIATAAAADGVEGRTTVKVIGSHTPTGHYPLDGAKSHAQIKHADIAKPAGMVQVQRCAASALRPYAKMLCEHQTTKPMQRPLRLVEASATADTMSKAGDTLIETSAHTPKFRVTDLRKPNADNGY